VAAPLLIAAALAAGLGWSRAPVTEVQFVAPGAADPERLRATFGVASGSPLSREAVRRGVQALMATGEAEDVEVTASEGPGGVALRVEVQVASRVREIVLDGLPRRARRLVRSELGVDAGAPLRIARFERALSRAQERLRQDGYPQAVLEPDLDFDVAGGTVAVRVVGNLGPPRLVSHLEVAGVGTG
jgi:outer membrane protein assembly factor BamA